MSGLEIIQFDDVLGGGLAEADERVKANIEKYGYLEYMAIVEEEKKSIEAEMFRKSNEQHVKRALVQSGLGKRFFSRRFDTFNVNDKNKAAYEACRRIVLERSAGVLLQGKNGIGKTHLIAATINELAAKGKRVRFGNITTLMDRYGKAVTNCDYLAIDDLGQEYSMGYKQDDAKVFFYNVVNKLYEQEKGVMITTNLTAAETEKKYGAAVLSRLQEMCEIVKYDDIDYRAQKNGN